MSLCHIAKPQLELLLCKLHWWDQLNVPWDMLPWEDGSPDTAPTNGSDTDETQESYKSGSQSQTSGEMVDSWEHKPVEALFMDAAAFHVDFGKASPFSLWLANGDITLTCSVSATRDTEKMWLLASSVSIHQGQRRQLERSLTCH